jgi:predicted nucleic acid-binding protein
MYLVDTNVLSEARKKSKANKGVRTFFKQAIEDETQIFISVVTVGELRRGVELIRYRGDMRQANQLERYQPGCCTALGTAAGATSRKRFGQANCRNGADLRINGCYT